MYILANDGKLGTLNVFHGVEVGTTYSKIAFQRRRIDLIILPSIVDLKWNPAHVYMNISAC